MKKIALGFSLLFIIVFALYLLFSKNAKLIWNSDDIVRYEKCEKFGKSYPCTKGFSVPLGIAGCSYVGLWIKNLDIKIPIIDRGCMI